MKKITLLFSVLFLTTLGWQVNAQILNQNAAWPNAAWTLNGTYDAPSLLNDPTTTANFSYDDDNAGSGSTDILQAESPTIDLTAVSGGGETWLNVDYDYNYNLGTTFNLEYYDADAATWVVWEALVDNSSLQSAWCAGITGPATTSSTLDISGFTATQLSGFKYRFHYDASAGWGWGFCMSSPTIVSSMPPSCLDPTVLTASNMTLTSADLGWTENGTATTWDIEWGTTGFTQGTGTMVTGTTTNPHALTGLTAQTSYDFYVRADCGATNGTSAWVGPFTFFTGYCTPSSTGIDTYVDNFTTSNGSVNISNLATGFTTGGYADYTAQSVQSFASGSFDFNGVIVGGTAGFSIWVDWNNDLVFDDATEKVFNTTSYGSGPFAGAISVPGGTAIGNYTMRITTDWNQSNPSNPCADQSRAEFEDYTIEVIAAPTCLPPSALTASNITPTSADLGWTENGTATTWDIEWGTAGFTQGTGAMVTGTTTNPYALTGLTAQTSYDFYVRADCGGGDTSTWGGPFTFNSAIQSASGVTCSTGTATFLFTEEFDAQGSWTGDISATATNGDWVLPQTGATTSSSTGPDTAYSASNYVYYEASGSTTDTASLISPMIDLTNANKAELSFWMHAYGADMSTLTVGVSTSVTGPFTPVFTHTGQLQTSGADAWQNVGVNLDSYAGQQVYIEFNYFSTGGFNADMALDLVKVEVCDITNVCSDPSSLTTTNVTNTSADLGWTENGTATTWDIEWGTAGFTQGTGTMVTGTMTNPYALTGLTAGTAYEFYVRADCGSANISAWSTVGTFNTTTVGLDDLNGNVTLTVYPNPTTGVFTLTVNTTDVNELDIKVMNIQGQVVFTKNNFDNISNINELIDLSENANGIYYVTVTTDRGVITHKIVVQ